MTTTEPAGQQPQQAMTASREIQPPAKPFGGQRPDAWKRLWGWPGLLAVTVLVADQASKWLVVANWPVGTLNTVIPGFFNFVHVRNPGAAWGILADHTWLLGLLSLLAFLGMAVFFRRLHEDSRLAAMALGAILGGIAGNLIDRWARQSVVDFLDFHFRGRHWPAFNIADSAICVGVILLMLWNFRNGRRQMSKES
ncbi:MAG: signal peptidase II [Lentisphaeria bacterium]|nr:signal peptidase II [Lentisphaeria bacterium]